MTETHLSFSPMDFINTLCTSATMATLHKGKRARESAEDGDEISQDRPDKRTRQEDKKAEDEVRSAAALVVVLNNICSVIKLWSSPTTATRVFSTCCKPLHTWAWRIPIPVSLNSVPSACKTCRCANLRHTFINASRSSTCRTRYDVCR